MKYKKICEWCNSEFETENSTVRFCSKSCSAKYRIKKFGPVKVSDEGRKHQSENLKNSWKKADFRNNNHKRMTENNPMFKEEVKEKVKVSILKNGGYSNNYIYGNGRISKYESIAYDILIPLGYYYNYVISTKLAKDAFPEISYPSNYKPDFVNLITKTCIEIDGPSHCNEHQKQLDIKKDECLKYLGFKVYRFTHEQIDSGEFYREVIKIGKVNF